MSTEFAEICTPLDSLRSADKIEWTEELLKSFEKVKEIFNKELSVRMFDPNKETWLTTDMGEQAITEARVG